MKQKYIVLMLVSALCLQGVSLQQAYREASPANGYQHYIELDANQIYTGGLLVGKVLDPIRLELEGSDAGDVCIQGNGAIIDLQGEQIGTLFNTDKLDISDAVIINGSVRYAGVDNGTFQQVPRGSVHYCTFYQPHDFGVRLQGAGSEVDITRNICVDAVETGPDYAYANGFSFVTIPTGGSFSGDITFMNPPRFSENWSYHNNEDTNRDSLRHFNFL
jgi:hypothetical protein